MNQAKAIWLCFSLLLFVDAAWGFTNEEDAAEFPEFTVHSLLVVQASPEGGRGVAEVVRPGLEKELQTVLSPQPPARPSPQQRLAAEEAQLGGGVHPLAEELGVSVLPPLRTVEHGPEARLVGAALLIDR